jgi:glycosyltransferase involved in cell wall biosynthesis
MRLVQINLQSHFGGGEVYTAFLCRALEALGVATLLFAHQDADFWERLDLPHSTEIRRVANAEAISTFLPDGALWLLGHGALPVALRQQRRANWLLSAIAHMPVQGRNPRIFDGHDQVFAVSDWVREGLAAADVPVWPMPLYGVADLADLVCRPTSGVLRRRSRYDWDRRKGRDRLLALLEPLIEALRTQQSFVRRPGLTLGIVSRLTPIKQFPLLFSYLAPLLARYPGVNLEIFGSGGYASVRDLDRALAPMAGRVRYWGQQNDVRAAYAELDYLITGLPEKEALGLNVIEAQACNLPVLAVKAAPFTETVAEGLTGFFYRDPREDEGVDFIRLLEQVLARTNPLQPVAASGHLAQFSFAAFINRLRPVVAWVQRQTQSGHS